MGPKLEHAFRESLNALSDYGNVLGDMSCTDGMTYPSKPKEFLRNLRETLRTIAPDEPFSNVMERLEKLAEEAMTDED